MGHTEATRQTKEAIKRGGRKAEGENSAKLLSERQATGEFVQIVQTEPQKYRRQGGKSAPWRALRENRYPR
jgi:hypothetical protein